MYDVEWTERAYEDLCVKVKSEAVAQKLIDVSEQALDAPESDDGGQLGPLLWRRGLTPQCRAELDTADPLDGPTSTSENAWDFVLVYKRRGFARSGYQVIAVLTNGELAAGLDDLPDLDFPPQS